MRFLHKLRTNSAQHTLEYTVVLVLVMGAIIIMGPYVIRSWNANLKGWDDSVEDSFQDILITSPNPVDVPGCSCLFEDAGCGPNGNCLKFERFRQYVCTPTGCGLFQNPPCPCGAGSCESDSNCCYDEPTGLCGPLATHVPGGCPDGEMEWVRLCGVNGGYLPVPISYYCQPDPLNCDFNCVAPIAPPPATRNAITCPLYGVGLTGNTNNTLVAACSGLPGRCEMICDPSFNPPLFPNPTGTACVSCDPGKVFEGACPPVNPNDPVRCEKGSCPTGFCQTS